MTFNVTDNFLFNDDDPTHTSPKSDPNYPLGISDRSWFTGSHTPGVSRVMQDRSFFQLCEHELGHFLGMRHPNADGQANCANNVTQCSAPSVMWQGENLPNRDPLPVSCEDKNAFRKLYCPDVACQNCTSAVTEVSNKIFGSVFPNPSTGSLSVQYGLQNDQVVTIQIFNILGEEVWASNYTGHIGVNSVAIIQKFTAGNYICRIQAGKTTFSMPLKVK